MTMGMMVQNSHGSGSSIAFLAAPALLPILSRPGTRLIHMLV